MFSQKMIYGDGSNPPAASKMGIKLFLILLEVRLTDLLKCMHSQLYSDILSTWVRMAALRGAACHHWGLLMRFLPCSRTPVYFVIFICLASINPWPCSAWFVCQETQKIKTIKNSGEQKNHNNKNKPTTVEWGVVSIYSDTSVKKCVLLAD